MYVAEGVEGNAPSTKLSGKGTLAASQYDRIVASLAERTSQISNVDVSTANVIGLRDQKYDPNWPSIKRAHVGSLFS